MKQNELIMHTRELAIDNSALVRNLLMSLPSCLGKSKRSNFYNTESSCHLLFLV